MTTRETIKVLTARADAASVAATFAGDRATGAASAAKTAQEVAEQALTELHALSDTVHALGDRLDSLSDQITEAQRAIDLVDVRPQLAGLISQVTELAEARKKVSKKK